MRDDESTVVNQVWGVFTVVEEDSSDVPGLREPLTSAGPPGVMELMMVPRSARPESSPPTTWKPRQHKQTFTHILYFKGEL